MTLEEASNVSSLMHRLGRIQMKLLESGDNMISLVLLTYAALFILLLCVDEENIWTDEDCHYYAKKSGRTDD